MVGNKMKRFTDIDPDAGDKAWDREKERDLEAWLERKRLQTELEINNTQMMRDLIEALKGLKQ
jgi:hypothetical protein